MKKLLYLGLLSVCVLLGSCVEKNVSNVFDKVERYMDVYRCCWSKFLIRRSFVGSSGRTMHCC